MNKDINIKYFKESFEVNEEEYCLCFYVDLEVIGEITFTDGDRPETAHIFKLPSFETLMDGDFLYNADEDALAIFKNTYYKYKYMVDTECFKTKKELKARYENAI